jgi:hypothetical protein
LLILNGKSILQTVLALDKQLGHSWEISKPWYKELTKFPIGSRIRQIKKLEKRNIGKEIFFQINVHYFEKYSDSGLAPRCIELKERALSTKKHGQLIRGHNKYVQPVLTFG